MSPNVNLRYGEYRFCFFSNENGEPMHVHAYAGTDPKNNAKFWILPDGTVGFAHNKARIPDQDITKIIKFLSVNYAEVVAAWYRHFGTL